MAVGGPALWHSSKKVWLEFKNLQDFSVLGSGVIHGRGRRWWAQVCRAKSSVNATSPSVSSSLLGCSLGLAMRIEENNVLHVNKTCWEVGTLEESWHARLCEGSLQVKLLLLNCVMELVLAFMFLQNS